MEQENKFHVIGQSGKMYEIDTNKRQHNVFEVDPLTQKRVKEFCITTPHVPSADQFAAQVLMLKTEENEFYRQSNIWDLGDVGSHTQIHYAGLQLTEREELSLGIEQEEMLIAA